MHNLGFAGTSHEPLVAAYLPNEARDFSIAASRHGRPAVVRSLQREIDREAADTIVISAEHFSSRFGDSEASELAADFARYDCRVVVIVREHGAFIRSAYSQAVRAGGDLTFDDYVGELVQPRHRYIRYQETIAPWEKALGREKISVSAYAPGRNVVELLCASIVAPNLPLPAAAPYLNSASLGAAEIEALRLANKALSAREGAPANYARWLQRASVRNRIAALLAKADGESAPQPLRLSAERRRQLDDVVAGDRRWLAESYGVQLASETAAFAPAEFEPAEFAAAELLAEALVARVKRGRWGLIGAAAPLLSGLAAVSARWRSLCGRW